MIELLLFPVEGSPKEISNKAYELVKSKLTNKNTKILRGSMGKPYLENGEFYFSVSHTDSLIAIAFAPFDVGIDIEEAHRKISKGVGSRFLEGSCDISDWVHFEAFSKLHGDGISIGYSKMKTTPHNYCQLEFSDHKICICSFGDISITLI